MLVVIFLLLFIDFPSYSESIRFNADDFLIYGNYLYCNKETISIPSGSEIFDQFMGSVSIQHRKEFGELLIVAVLSF